MFDTSKFSQEFRAHRQGQKATYREAAKQIGTTPATLHRIEQGGTPGLEVFARCCLWAGWKEVHLFFKSPQP